MLDWLSTIDWKFWIGSVLIPIATFIGGIFVGRKVEKKSHSKISGNNNSVIQNSRIDSK